jgi:hypothetical protein
LNGSPSTRPHTEINNAEDALTPPLIRYGSILGAASVLAVSGCGVLPPTTIPLPERAEGHCGDFPEGAPLVFARDGVTLQELGLAPDNPNPLANPRGTVYVSAEEMPMVGTSGTRAWCMVPDDPTQGGWHGNTGAVSDDWRPPE